jgi:ParB family chromosome partitioning protein
MSDMNQDFLKTLLSGKPSPYISGETGEGHKGFPIKQEQPQPMPAEHEQSETAQAAQVQQLTPSPSPPILNREEGLEQLPINLLEEHPDNPIPPYKEEEMDELIESVRANGVITPLLVRPFGVGYQIIDGRNRRNAAQILAYTTVPCYVRELSDDDAMIYLVETIFRQRDMSKVSIMKKAHAYRLWLDALKRQGRRTDLTSAQVAPKLSAEIIGDQQGISKDQVKRYVRLTYLIQPLQDKVDEGKANFPFSTAVLISYLTEANQSAAYQFFLAEHDYGISMKLAEVLRQEDYNGTEFDQDALAQIWESIAPPIDPTEEKEEPVILPPKKLQHYFPYRYSASEIEEIVLMALDLYVKLEQSHGGDST